MNWRVAGYVAVGLIAFAIGLVYYLPASLAAGWVADDTPVRLDGVSGTLLDGRAAYASLPHGALDNLHWQVHPGALLLGEISATVQVDSDLGHISGQITRGVLGGNKIDDVHGEATIGWLSDLAGYTFVPLSGRIALDLDHAAFNDNLKVTALDGRIQLTNSRWQLLDPPLDLGRFRAGLERVDEGVKARMLDSHGPLALTGSIQLSDDQHYELDVKLRARTGADTRLEPMLQQLGSPDSQGWYHVRERGSL